MVRDVAVADAVAVVHNKYSVKLAEGPAVPDSDKGQDQMDNHAAKDGPFNRMGSMPAARNAETTSAV